jgi:hypothetical protein
VQGAARPPGDPAAPAGSLAEFRRRLDELRAEVERRRLERAQGPRATVPATPAPDTLSALSDADLNTAIEFLQKFVDAADTIAGKNDPAAAISTITELFGTLSRGVSDASDTGRGATRVAPIARDAARSAADPGSRSRPNRASRTRRRKGKRANSGPD